MNGFESEPCVRAGLLQNQPPGGVVRANGPSKYTLTSRITGTVLVAAKPGVWRTAQFSWEFLCPPFLGSSQRFSANHVTDHHKLGGASRGAMMVLVVLSNDEVGEVAKGTDRSGSVRADCRAVSQYQLTIPPRLWILPLLTMPKL